MLRLTLAQMRRSLGRLTAAAIAIAIGAAFVAATLLTGNIITRTSYDAVTAKLAGADLVVDLNSRYTPAVLDKIRATPGVAHAERLDQYGFEIGDGNRSEYVTALAAMDDPDLDSVDVTSGKVPGAGQTALPTSLAERLHVGVGDRVRVTTYDADGNPVPVELSVSGITDDPQGAWSTTDGAALFARSDMEKWAGEDLTSDVTVLVRSDDPEAARAALAGAIPADTAVRTRAQAAELAVKQVSGDGKIVVTFVLGFAAVALVVAGLVISNTFQVLVAQRTRTLALLRCVGARRSQLRTSVVTEATILGVASSLVGVLAGTLLTQAALLVVGPMNDGVPLPKTITFSPAVLLVPLVAGTLVTVLASLVPARAATRVAPIAALRPLDAPVLSSHAGRVRLVLSLLMVVGGFAGLALAVVGSFQGVSALAMLGLGVLSGAVSFVGVLVGAVFWIPKVVGGVGRLVDRAGPTARLSTANTVRNPRRTAATSTALLIGVTLVVMMSTGAASARASLSAQLDQQFPVDMLVEAQATDDAGHAQLPADALATVRGVDGVQDAETLRTSFVSVGDAVVGVAAVTPERARALLRDDSSAAHLDDSTIVTPRGFDVDREHTDTVRATDGSGATVAGGTSLQLRHVADTGLHGSSLVTPATLAKLDPGATDGLIWVRVASGANAVTVLNDVRDALDGSVSVESAAAERAGYEQIISTLLTIVIGLLAVAVVIALVGVANTLSLSVLERQRESATLRAIGLSRRRLRWSLGIEGMLIAGVGALLGVLLGAVYGWAGSAVVLGRVGELHLAVPWRDLVVVLAVAVAAGLLASALPARRAARTSPVAALGVE
ncbi:ABC transporter permease [Cellulomonas sp. HZM]|uniref:ABC transporter permease n=1 Tax=Cellulomonas sp. HZM TaxID=1454010 RepID=UPI0004932005|nr:FtsX-like permease family protein [Cellulomonas sp. HZM]